MSKFFLDPRDKYFDSASSISFKSFTQSTSESRVSQGLLRLNNIFWEKSKKQAFFISWKSFTQGSLYKLWKEVFKDHPNMEDFDTVLKILHKRKTKVDELWGMLKTEELKHQDLLETNKNLQTRINNLQAQVKVYTNQSVQVNFLQDSALRKTHDELAKQSKTLRTKEQQLENFENILTQKFDQLILREKNLHQKELSGLLFNETDLMKSLKSEIFEFRSKIFPHCVETDFWIQVAESVQVTPGQVKKLQDYEEELFKKFEETEKILNKFFTDIDTSRDCANAYTEIYKPMSVGIAICSNLLISGNSKSKQLIKDDSVISTIKILIKAVISVPSECLTSSIKIFAVFYELLNYITNNTNLIKSIIFSLDTREMSQLLDILIEGCQSLKQFVCQLSYCIIKNIIHDLIFKGAEQSKELTRIHSESFKRLMRVLLILVFGGEGQNISLISYPLLGLINLFKQEYLDILPGLFIIQGPERAPL